MPLVAIGLFWSALSMVAWFWRFKGYRKDSFTHRFWFFEKVNIETFLLDARGRWIGFNIKNCSQGADSVKKASFNKIKGLIDWVKTMLGKKHLEFSQVEFCLKIKQVQGFGQELKNRNFSFWHFYHWQLKSCREILRLIERNNIL